MVVWERLAAARPTPEANWVRRRTNLILAAIGAGLTRLIVPSGLATAAALAEHFEFGLFRLAALPTALTWAAAIIALDCAVYLQHRVFHRVPMLWRVHAVHHSDRAFDVTTGVRFHPVELLLSLAWKSSAVVLLGVPAGAALLFEFILSTMALLTHGNVRLPDSLERRIRSVFVTPTLHRIHHSESQDEHDRNFGFNLSIWDRFFGTYRSAARDGERQLVIGLPGELSRSGRTVAETLRMPLTGAETH